MKRTGMLIFFIFMGFKSLELAAAGLEQKASFDLPFASKAVQLSLHCVDQETPHYYDRYSEPKGLAKQRHPAFFGCYDWHSAVHGHWAMLRVLNAFPLMPERAEILKVLAAHLRPEHIQKELEVFAKDPFFERPYGWAWLLRLVEELDRSSFSEAKEWRMAVRPLEERIVASLMRYLEKMDFPSREGVHINTAYALVHAWDYAEATKHVELLAAIKKTAVKFYARDRNCPIAYEPSASDFISPCFAEADLMRRVLSEREFLRWWKTFLPTISDHALRPYTPKDMQDGLFVHLVGLMYQKAASFKGIASQLPPTSAQRKRLLAAAEAQAAAARKVFFDTGYGGTHWIASFAIYYHSGAGK